VGNVLDLVGNYTPATGYSTYRCFPASFPFFV
jgi:hypothetical protein